MKSLSTSASAAALGLDAKALDNILAREAKLLVKAGRQGRSRQISVDVLEMIAVAMILNRDLGVSIAKGLELAVLIVHAPTHAIPIGSLGALTFDLSSLRRALELSISEALESSAEATRGRPTTLKTA